MHGLCLLCLAASRMAQGTASKSTLDLRWLTWSAWQSPRLQFLLKPPSPRSQVSTPSYSTLCTRCGKTAGQGGRPAAGVCHLAVTLLCGRVFGVYWGCSHNLPLAGCGLCGSCQCALVDFRTGARCAMCLCLFGPLAPPVPGLNRARDAGRVRLHLLPPTNVSMPVSHSDLPQRSKSDDSRPHFGSLGFHLTWALKEQ